MIKIFKLFSILLSVYLSKPGNQVSLLMLVVCSSINSLTYFSSMFLRLNHSEQQQQQHSITFWNGKISDITHTYIYIEKKNLKKNYFCFRYIEFCIFDCFRETV